MAQLTGKDWSIWLKGLIGAGVSGGCVAISTMTVAPETFNIRAGLNKLLMVAFVSFIISIAKYLSAKPFPDGNEDGQ